MRPSILRNSQTRNSSCQLVIGAVGVLVKTRQQCNIANIEGTVCYSGLTRHVEWQPSSKLKVDFSHVQFGLINLGEKGGSLVRLLPVDIA